MRVGGRVISAGLTAPPCVQRQEVTHIQTHNRDEIKIIQLLNTLK